MAGRGVDIILGGEPPKDAKGLKDWEKKHQEVWMPADYTLSAYRAT